MKFYFCEIHVYKSFLLIYYSNKILQTVWRGLDYY